MLDEIMEAEKDRAKKTKDNSYLNRFSTFNIANISTIDYKIIYGIIANWEKNTLINKLPFFSKINLKKTVEDLRRLGYTVQYKRIQISN